MLQEQQTMGFWTFGIHTANICNFERAIMDTCLQGQHQFQMTFFQWNYPSPKIINLQIFAIIKANWTQGQLQVLFQLNYSYTDNPKTRTDIYTTNISWVHTRSTYLVIDATNISKILFLRSFFLRYVFVYVWMADYEVLDK